MAHELDGDWRLFVIQSLAGGGFRMLPDGVFHLSLNAAGILDPAISRHGANILEGSAIPDVASGGFKILIIEKVAAQFRPYKGFLIVRGAVVGEPISVACGMRFPLAAISPVLLEEDSEEALPNLAQQEDGTWVATRP